MSTVVSVSCPVCHAVLHVPYILVGTRTTCTTCDSRFVARIALGTTYPDTEHEMTFAQFHKLLSTRSEIAELVGEWYGSRTSEEGGIRPEMGDPVELVQLHVRIQSNPIQQLTLYRAAMSLWK